MPENRCDGKGADELRGGCGMTSKAGAPVPSDAEAYAKRFNNITFGLFGAWLGVAVLFWIRAIGIRSPESPPFEATAWPLLAASIAIGALAASLPRRWYVPSTLATEARLYERIGVLRLRAIITDGDWINARVRRRFPGYRVHAGRGGLARAARRSFVSERAHHGFWWFGIGASLAAWIGGWPDWSVPILIGNIATNLLPILLQRYTRARLMRLRPELVHAAFDQPA